MSRSRRSRSTHRPSTSASTAPVPAGTPRATRRGAGQAPPARSSNGRWLLLAGLLVAVAAGAALVIRGVGSPAGPGSSAGPASTASIGGSGGPVGDLVSGPSLPTYDATTADPAVGQTIPNVNGAGRAGEQIRIDAEDGRAKVLLFITHWCSHCQAEVPRIQEWLNGGGTTGNVDLYAISTGADPGRPNYPPEAWLDREGWTVPTVVDDGRSSVGQAFGLSAFPYWVFVDTDGSVALRAVGELSIADLEAIVGQLGSRATSLLEAAPGAILGVDPLVPELREIR